MKLNELLESAVKFKSGDKVWHRTRKEVGIFKMLDDQNTSNNECSWVEFPNSDEEVMVSSDKLEQFNGQKK